MDFDITIIGAGVVGLATARRISRPGRQVLVLERHESFGRETSSRNSEVIHGGLYYEPGSLKARLCCRGRELLYEFCEKAHVPFRKTGKVVVANGADEEKILETVFRNATTNGVPGITCLEAGQVKSMLPGVRASAALLSPETGIVDAHLLMRRCASMAEDRGASFAYGTELISAELLDDGFRLTVSDNRNEVYDFTSRFVVNSAGLDADRVAAMFGIDTAEAGYDLHYAKGCYFDYSGPDLGLDKLVYPVPGSSSLGIHLVLDLAGGCRFGPDIEFLRFDGGPRRQDYDPRPDKLDDFLESIKSYLPCMTAGRLRAGFCGIRPKLSGPGEPARDFVITREDETGIHRLVNLVGIESPGLTSCLAIAEEVESLLEL